MRSWACSARSAMADGDASDGQDTERGGEDIGRSGSRSVSEGITVDDELRVTRHFQVTPEFAKQFPDSIQVTFHVG